VQHNPPAGGLYDRLKERGKHQKVAEVACMLWARGDRLRPEGQQRAVRSDLREVLEGSAGREEIHWRGLQRAGQGPELRYVGSGLPKRSKEKEEGHLAREGRWPFSAWPTGLPRNAS